jgi:hypothetical protein
MSDSETKSNRSFSRKRNMIAKKLRDHGELKGAFSPRIINPKKKEYKREKVNMGDINAYQEDGGRPY